MDGTITRQQLADRQAAETKILQKVNAVHRNAFLEKYPTQIEHCLRLLSERLQAGLDKRDGCDISDPDTWRMTTSELADLAEALHYIHNVWSGLKTEK